MVNRIGQQVGNYRIVRLLGQGGFAEVYLGEHIYLNTLAAIKVLHEQLTSESMEEFRKEARTIAHLEHPHIVRVLEFGIEQGFPFLVMPYAPNGSLRQRHPKGVRLDLQVIVPYVKQIADALQYAHSNKLIHRDVKPENMLLGGRNDILLSDFGIAVEAHNTLSQTFQQVGGTIPYMAPEQIQGKPHPASDQYALGIVVYEWLCGTRPFNGSTIEIAVQHQSTLPPSLREKTPTILSAVEQVVLKALAKDPQQRFVNVQEFANALEQASQPEQPVYLTSSGTYSSPYPAPTVNVQSSAKTQPPLGTTFLTYRGHSVEIDAVAWSPDGKYIASAGGDGIQVWNAITGERAFIQDTIQVSTLAYSPDGKYIAVGEKHRLKPLRHGGYVAVREENVRIWLVEINNHRSAFSSLFAKPIRLYFQYPHHAINTLAWSPNGMYLASGNNEEGPIMKGKLQIWNMITKQQVRKQDLNVKDIAWSPNGTCIAIAGDWMVDIWDTATDRHISTYTDKTHWSIRAIAWSPDGTRIVFASENGLVCIWDMASDDAPYVGHHPHNSVNDVAWSPDATRIASASNDGTIQIWDATSGDNIFTYRNHLGAINTLTWSSDGTRIASGSFDGTIHVWQAI